MVGHYTRELILKRLDSWEPSLEATAALDSSPPHPLSYWDWVEGWTFDSNEAFVRNASLESHRCWA